MLDDVNHRTPNNNISGDSEQQQRAAEQLFNLFVGNERRHIKNFGPPVLDTENRKWSLTVRTHDGPANLDLWQRHLDHEYNLSIVPLLDDGTCWFACIDVDDYDINIIDICQRIATLKLPLLPCLSKSSGLHLFVFFKEPVSAKLVIPALRHWAVRLNLAKFEIFPTNDGTTGEFSRAIAMPYGPTWDVLPEQAVLGPHGGSALLEHAFFRIQRLTAEDLPKPQGKPQESRKIPMPLQTAIDSMGPYPFDPIEGKRRSVARHSFDHLATARPWF